MTSVKELTRDDGWDVLPEEYYQYTPPPQEPPLLPEEGLFPLDTEYWDMYPQDTE